MVRRCSLFWMTCGRRIPSLLQLLKSMLTFLGDKVDVIVTTCNQAIARKICTVVQPYRLNPLGDDTCWEIIKKSICFEEDEVLVKIGWKIASKCRGIPPAALEYSSMLAGSRDPTEWEEIMESNVLYCTSLRLGALFQTLFLSYRYMPPELRLCFDYNCDIFPNGHNIFKHDLVHQWIALDFIEPSERLSATDIAEGYITRLLDMSFFQTAKSDLASGNDDKGAAMFTMPDMVHGFASWNSSNHYRRVTNCHGELDNLDDDYLRALHCVGCSKVEFNNGSFSRKKCLRVLELKESSVEKLPDSIWQLRHLGYLKISEFSGLVALPESFGDLTNLLHIDLSGCCGLVNLPESFGKLIRLMHVNLSGCSGIATLPGSFGDLMNLSYLSLSCCHGLAAIPEPLQKLGKLVHLDLSFWSCFEGIGEGLGGLTNLERLNLSNPCCHLAQQRFQLQELKDGLCKLTSLSYLNLSMCLNPIFYYKSEEDNLHYIESCVSSLSSLEHLDLSHNTFLFDLPQSLGDLNKLHTLDLSGCIRLKRIGEMKSLKFMALMNCRGLESCNFVVHVDDDNAYSSNIVQLEDVNCQELQISCLEKVRYKEEAQRIKLVEKQKLESLKLSWTLDSLRSVEERALLEDSVLLGELVPPPNLECLEVNNYSGTCLPEYFGELTSLQELKIVRCRQLNSLPPSINKLSNLKDLSIFHCPELEKWCQLEENKKTLAHIPNKNYEAVHVETKGPPSCIILPIFGIAGSGKTTLAQLVFNDDAHSLQEYNFRVWVYVSPELNFHRIGQSILHQVVSGGGKKEEINEHTSNSDVEGIEHIMKYLQELLNGKKVLLVLDDLWEEDSIQLQLLKSMINFLGDKVDVIVTTCNQAIAWKICTARPYMLNPLGHDTCWELIKKSIRLEEQNEELEKIGLEIASKCWGLPSAAQAIAGMLDSRDPTRWEEVMTTDMWDISVRAYLPSRIMLSTFNLSYMSMPPDLRLCVDYCCNIFPNDHNIGKDDLTHQWIALHLTETFERLSATQVAEDYIRRLLDMSFLQTAKSEPARVAEDKGAILFTMHNLAHILTHELRQSKRYSLKTNHCGKLDNDDYARALRCVGCSRMELNNDSFSSKSCLRVLELKESDMQKLPDSICKLRHLRYLKISQFSGLVTLPESVGHLINLLHVNLSGCSGLINLPESFGKLIHLVHVNLSGCSELVSLPESFGELVNLVYFDLSDCTGIATLPESFGDLVNLSHIDLSRCHRLSETLEVLRRFVKLVYLDLSFWSCFQGIEKCLGRLTNLEHLNLSNPCCYLSQQHSHLQDIKNVMGKLTRLRYLNLSMCLNHIFYYHESKEDSLQYIGDCLGGLSSLEHLDLSHNTFLVDLPQILGDLNRLHTLNLSGCIRLKNVGEMKSLKFIALRNCRGLESCKFVVRDIDDDAYSSSNIVQLEDVNCQELQISCLEKVKSKEEAQRIRLVEKQKLEKLKLSWTLDCHRSVEDSALLRELAPPRNLQCLEVNGYNGTYLPEYLGELTSLQELKIICCKQLTYLPDSIQKLTNLKNLCIFNCPEVEKWCQLEDNKKMLTHIPNKNYEEHGSTSRPEIEDDCRLNNDLEAE